MALDSPVDRVLEQAVAHGDVPGAVAAVTDRDGTVYEAAIGAARLADGMPMRVDHVFRIASMTKLVTSIAVLMLNDEGCVDLDAPLAEYVPGYVQPEVLEEFDADTGRYTTRPARRAITVRRLLTHTSGYGYWFLDARLLRVSGPAPDLLHPPFLIHEPGERFAYSTSTDVLGQIIEPVTGQPLERFFAERVFGPLGMTDTGFALPADPERLTAVHYRKGGRLVQEPLERTGVAPRGGGGLYSSAHDYLCLLRLLLNDGRRGGERLLSSRAVRLATTNQIGELGLERQASAFAGRTNDFLFMDGTQKFGCGVMIETAAKPGRRAARSYSWGGILNTYFWGDPESGIAAVLLMQMKPFCEPACIALYEAFERAVYAELRASAPKPGTGEIG